MATKSSEEEIIDTFRALNSKKQQHVTAWRTGPLQTNTNVKTISSSSTCYNVYITYT